MYLKIGIVWIGLGMLLLPLVGYAWQLWQLKINNKRVLRLENEMLEAHAEILHLQKQLAEMKLCKEKRRKVIEIENRELLRKCEV